MELLISVDYTVITLVRMLTFLELALLQKLGMSSVLSCMGCSFLTPGVICYHLPLVGLGTAEISQEQLPWALLCFVSPSCAHTKQTLMLERA